MRINYVSPMRINYVSQIVVAIFFAALNSYGMIAQVWKKQDGNTHAQIW